DAAFLKLDEPLDERQADTESALQPVQRRRSLDEYIEDARQEIRAYADPVVLHPQLCGSICLGHADAYRSARRRVLQGVRDEVDHDLIDSRRIGIDPCRPSGKRDDVTVELTALPKGGDGRVGDLVEVGRLPAELDLGAHDAPDVQKVVHETRQMNGLPGEDAARSGGRVARLAESLEDLHGVADGAERIPQLVPQHGQELVLRAVRRFGVLSGRLLPRKEGGAFRLGLHLAGDVAGDLRGADDLPGRILDG